MLLFTWRSLSKKQRNRNKDHETFQSSLDGAYFQRNAVGFLFYDFAERLRA